MRDTYFGPDNQLQSMVFSATYSNKKLQSKPKGIKQVLIKWEKWPPGGLVLECKECKKKVQNDLRISCCTHQVMSLEPDFLA